MTKSKPKCDPVFGPISQSGTIDGVIICIGGKNETVTITIQTREGAEAPCKAKRQLGKELGHYIFGQEMRFSGTGRWTRNEEGAWILDSFFITSYEVLDDRSLIETVGDLRAVKGSDWSKVSDPWKELDDLRGE